MFENWEEAMEAFDNYLNEIAGDEDGVLTLGGYYTIEPAEVIKEMSPTTYRSHLYDWVDAQGIWETDDWPDLDLVPKG